MTAVGEDKKNISWICSGMGKVGIGWAWRQNCEIAGGGKALFIKADSVKWHFFPLKLKCLSIINALYIWLLPMKPNHLPAQHKAIISTEQQLVSVSCASAEAHVCICMCACECVHESTGTKKL